MIWLDGPVHDQERVFGFGLPLDFGYVCPWMAAPN